MTLGEAIQAAHARGDHEERNRLMWHAHDHATMRDLAALLGVGLATVHRWTHDGENPCSRLDSSAALSGTLVPQLKIDPGAGANRPGSGTQEGTS